MATIAMPFQQKPPPSLWARTEHELLAEVHRMLGKNESEIVRLTREMEALLELLEQGKGLFQEQPPKRN